MGSPETSTPLGGGSGLIDVTRVPLEKLATLDSAPLRRLLERLTEEAERPTAEPLFAFQSVV
jgi:FXSXX-COOH protein